MRKPSNEKPWRPIYVFVIFFRWCAQPRLLDDRLRIVVAPEKVRLQPRPEDGYAWSVTSTNADLFKSSLSSCNIHLYQLIREGIGHTFEAVSTKTLRTSQSIMRDLLEVSTLLDILVEIALLTERKGGECRGSNEWFFYGRDLQASGDQQPHRNPVGPCSWPTGWISPRRSYAPRHGRPTSPQDASSWGGK